MSLVNRSALPKYNAVEQRQINKKKAKSVGRGPTKRYARKKVKR